MFRKKYYQILENHFQTREAVVTEIVNLEAILNLPKGTEYFISDIHGEFEGFYHILKTGAGIIGDKIARLYPDLSEEEKGELSYLVSYPCEALAEQRECSGGNLEPDWISQQISRLLGLLSYCASKYSRSKMRKKLPKRFSYIMEELLYIDESNRNKTAYQAQILACLTDLREIEDFMVATARVIKHLVIDHIHIVGDIFDRGSEAHKVMDLLMSLPSLDIQWGNHDILWMGAFCGSKACLLTLLRIATRYDYLYAIEQAYHINLRPLFLFAERHYQASSAFFPKGASGEKADAALMSQVHQALLVLQLKVEHGLMAERPEFDLSDRQFLDKIKGEKVVIQGREEELLSPCFQLVDGDHPHQLTAEEEEVVDSLLQSFQSSELIQKHMGFLFKKGALYQIYNGNLLYHGCLPMTDDGQLRQVTFEGQTLQGKSLLDFFEEKIQSAYAERTYPDRNQHHDYLWYAWLGKDSPLFGRHQMTTFERYFLADKTLHKEIDDPYYHLRDREDICQLILAEFGVNPETGHIINGHTPVQVKNGELPVRAGGRLFVIDGGLSKAYQGTTGIGGYTLINNSHGFQLVTHQAYTGVTDGQSFQRESQAVTFLEENSGKRKTIRETTIGQELLNQIEDLKILLQRLG